MSTDEPVDCETLGKGEGKMKLRDASWHAYS